MKTKENGVTLIALVTTIILLLILASIGITVGTSTIDTAEFTQFKSELKVMQNKVNELNQDNEIDIEKELSELSDDQKNIFNEGVIANIIYKGISTDEEKANEEKTKIQNGFRYFSKEYIQDKFGLDSVERDYLINVEYRYVIFPEGFEYEETTYYMIDQIEEGIYNVRYDDKNKKTGNFKVNITQENNKCKVEISDIKHSGYVDKWQVKYKLEGTSYWETSNDLSFYIKKEGTYSIKVVHGDEIDLGTETVKILYDGLITDKVRNEVIKIGDYVQYTPDSATTDSILEELGKYSGSTENTTSALAQESSLSWRVLDVVDGKVRLISEVPTSKITLQGAKGYNNAVYLLDKTCSTLYNNSTYAEKVQSLKIEDIQDHLKYNYKEYANSNVDTGKYGGTKTYTDASCRYYPNLFAKEKTGWVDEIQGTELDLSEQTTPIDETSIQAGTSIKITQTFWYKSMEITDFTDSIYYNLFINNGSNYSGYWMSSRCVDVTSFNARFYVRRVSSGEVDALGLSNSNDNPGSNAYALRPVITLNADVEIDTIDVTKDGSEVEKAWILKSE